MSAATSFVVTMIAVLGAVGLLPDGGRSHPAAAATPSSSAALSALVTTQSPSANESHRGDTARTTPQLPQLDTRTLPGHSGHGRRVVFSMTRQRVWLVGVRDRVRRTYLVSGSVTDNLHPGSYSVYSHSLHAVGVDDSGTMRFMVRFASGVHAAIGFHDIPVKDGELVQTRAELGTPRSHGCIRQARPDARALWRFAPVGTTVVVLP